ncbi:MAG TPA: nicotinamide riboside transporter PnuC [Thermoanaerobaculia bacterium]|jgi:nicotinamide mononucleotide transporter
MTAIESIAAAITLFSVWLSTRQHIVSWPTAIAGVSIYAWIFWQTRLYADFGLQFVFITLSIYGWYEWLYGGEQRSQLRVSRAPLRTHLIASAITIAFAAVLGTLLHRHTDASLPYADAALASASLLAQWQMTRKYLENWILWIVVDVFYIVMYASKELYVTAGLYAVFIVVCAVGWRDWRRELRAA